MTWGEVTEGDVVTTQGGGLCLVLDSHMHCRDLLGFPILKIGYVDLTDAERSAWIVRSSDDVIVEVLRGDKVMTW